MMEARVCGVEGCEQPAFGRIYVCPLHRDDYCLYCAKEMGPEKFLGSVCGVCVRKNHKAVVGR